MTKARCPGQNTLFWKPDDIFEVKCPVCDNMLEFFKDDAKRRCTKCSTIFSNPKLNIGCAEWCEFADKCLGIEK